MNEKTIYYVSGLPRSGSTLLMNILGQNPNFTVKSTNDLRSLLLTPDQMFNKTYAV